MKCRYCGAQLREGTTFCHECGRPVNNNANQNDNPYVLIAGSKIDLDEKTEIYQKAKYLHLKTIRRPFITCIPILGLSYWLELKREVLATEDKLLGFENQENIINAMLTDLIWSKLYKIEKRIRAEIFANIIMIILLIILVPILLSIISFTSKLRSFF